MTQNKNYSFTSFNMDIDWEHQDISILNKIHFLHLENMEL